MGIFSDFKKIAFFIILSLISLNLVQALDCQYQETENYVIQEDVYYHNNLEFGRNLNLSNLVKVEVQGYNILITNNLEVPITVNVIYRRDSRWFGISEERTTQRTINAQDFDTIRDEMNDISGCSSFGCSIGLVKYQFSEPNMITHQIEDVTKQRQICKPCGAENCLNDGQACNPLFDDFKCGSGICNIAGFCGKNKIVACPNDLLNCNDTQCLKPSTKEVGEGYTCNFECKSDRFENGKCLESTEKLKAIEDASKGRIILFGIFCLLLIFAGIGYFIMLPANKAKRLLDKYTKEIQELREERKRLDEERQKLDKEIEDFTKDNKHLESEITAKYAQIEKLDEDIKNAGPKAKKLIEEKLDKLKQEYDEKEKEIKQEHDKKREKILNNFDSEIASSKDRLNKSKLRIQFLKKEEEKSRNEIKNSKNKARNDYEQAYKLMEKNRHEIAKEIELETKRLSELQSKREEVEEELKKPRMVRFPQIGYHRVYIENGYYCYYNKNAVNPYSGNFVHRDLGKVHIYNKYKDYPFYQGKTLQKDEFEVHHIDHNKENNEITNLAIVPRNHQYIIKHENIFDRESGIKELLRAKIRQPHIKELDYD